MFHDFSSEFPCRNLIKGVNGLVGIPKSDLWTGFCSGMNLRVLSAASINHKFRCIPQFKGALRS